VSCELCGHGRGIVDIYAMVEPVRLDLGERRLFNLIPSFYLIDGGRSAVAASTNQTSRYLGL